MKQAVGEGWCQLFLFWCCILCGLMEAFLAAVYMLASARLSLCNNERSPKPENIQKQHKSFSLSRQVLQSKLFSGLDIFWPLRCLSVLVGVLKRISQLAGFQVVCAADETKRWSVCPTALKTLFWAWT